MTYRVEVAPEVLRHVQAAVELLAQAPRPPGVKKLVGEDNLLRVRTRDYQIVYEIHDDVLIVLVLAVGNRRDIYQRR